MKPIHLKTWLVAFVAAFSLLLSVVSAQAEYPDKPISCLVGYGAGGGTDQDARAFAELMSKELGQRVIIVNLPGALTANAVNELVKAKPDGYTLLYTTSTISMLKGQGISDLTYADMQPLCAAMRENPILVVNKTSPYATAKDFFAAVKANPGKLNMAVAAAGGTWHLGMIRLAKHNDMDFVIIPNSAGGSGMNARLLSGNADAAFLAPSEALSQVKSGLFRVLAISATERSSLMPDVPTFKELGYDLDMSPVRGLYAPKGLPDDVMKKLITVTKKIVLSKEWKEIKENLLSQAYYLGPEDFTNHLKQELVDYTKMLEEGGLLKKK